MNEQHAGRHLLLPDLPTHDIGFLNMAQQITLTDSACPSCGYIGRHLREFDRWTYSDRAFYAVCTHCGHWQEI